MIRKEELTLKKFTTGVTFYIFSTAIYENAPENPSEYEGPFPSYVLYDNLGTVSSLYTFDGQSTIPLSGTDQGRIWYRSLDNNYVPLSSATSNQYLTGHSITTQIASNLTQVQIDEKVNKILSRLSDTTRFTQASAATNYVFYKKNLIDDFYVDIKMERSYNSLDTLKIYNNLLNSPPVQEAKTGVVFGTLMAIQKLKNESGQSIKIPLKNVPLGIFNTSEMFPQLFSTDENGDRLSLNLKESSTSTEYFDTTSFDQDQNNYLRSGAAFSAVPAQYKYITKTNDNGEFILYNIPIGEQTVIFEIDLFKQGLTKDEIALNFFPFPVTEEPNIDTIPSFLYKQFPIDVVPAWGISQTGYTNLDINVNVDLRKWATYIFAPAAYGKEKLESTVAKNFINTLKIKVRDMTNVKFADKILELAQIPDDLDRSEGADYLWYNEMAEQRKMVNYYKFGCHVIKMPANLYDPNGFRTNNEGVPTTNKGVWVAAYQFRVFVNENVSFRDTGGYFYNGNFFSHYNVNYVGGSTDTTSFAGINPISFPYEKPWSISYPDQYKIPAMPTQVRYDWGGQRTFGAGTSANPYIMEEPAYIDGDLVGNIVTPTTGPVAGGFGIQSPNGVWAPNQIAYVATKDYMYKYESGVRWDEKYANGYEPYWNQSSPPSSLGPYNIAGLHSLAGMSSVVNGEKFQRVECGYGYFMKYREWPRVFRQSWAGDTYWGPDISSTVPGYTPPTTVADMKSIQGWNHVTYDLDDQNQAFAFDKIVYPKEGIDIYRIVNSGLDNIKIPENFIIPTSAVLAFGGHGDMCHALDVKNTGTVEAKLVNPLNTTLTVYKNDGTTQTIGTGGGFTLLPGERFSIDDNGGGGGSNRLETEITYAQMIFPGNDSFSTSTNKYETVNYTITLTVGWKSPTYDSSSDPASMFVNSNTVDIAFNVAAKISPDTWYFTSASTGSGAPSRQAGITGWGLTSPDNAMWGVFIESVQGAY